MTGCRFRSCDKLQYSSGLTSPYCFRHCAVDGPRDAANRTLLFGRGNFSLTWPAILLDLARAAAAKWVSRSANPRESVRPGSHSPLYRLLLRMKQTVCRPIPDAAKLHLPYIILSLTPACCTSLAEKWRPLLKDSDDRFLLYEIRMGARQRVNTPESMRFRTTEEVFRDHLDKWKKGLVEENIVENYAPDVLQLTCTGTDRGHAGFAREVAC
jgi:hypothetical protein